MPVTTDPYQVGASLTNVLQRQNPYVGPRAFREDESELFFGREWETNELYNLLVANRVLLLYSPSGAGKSSLVEAGLRPRLRQEGVSEIRIPGERGYRERARLSREGIEIDRKIYDALGRLAEGQHNHGAGPAKP